MPKIEEMLKEVYDGLSEIFKKETIYFQGKNGVNSLVLFDEPELIPGDKARYKIGNFTALVLKNDVPFLSIEIIPSEPTPPKSIAGLLPVHMVTRSIVINRKRVDNLKYDLDELENKILLLIVVPDQSGQVKEIQFDDLDEKFRGVIRLNGQYANVKDFAITPIRDLQSAIKKLTGYDKN